MIKTEIEFHEWLNLQLAEDIPEKVVSFCINISESPFSVEIIGSQEFDKNNDDWACNEDWVPEKRTMLVSMVVFGDSWKEAENNIFAFSKSFLSSSFENSVKINTAKRFLIGFVDGDLRCVL